MPTKAKAKQAKVEAKQNTSVSKSKSKESIAAKTAPKRGADKQDATSGVKKTKSD